MFSSALQVLVSEILDRQGIPGENKLDRPRVPALSANNFQGFSILAAEKL